MRIAFRTEGNQKQGMGDILGSIALADEFSRYSDEALFIVSGGEEAITAIKDWGYRVDTVSSPEEEQHTFWQFRPDAIVVNKLNNPSGYIKSLRGVSDLIVTIDDAGEEAGHADLNINVLYHVPGAITDPEYIALRGEFQELHGRTKPIGAEVEEVMITQGGGDICGITPRIIRSLDRMVCRPHFTVIIGPAFRHHVELEEALASSTLDLAVVHNARNMADLIWEADFAITSGGLTMFELACVGTPSLVICGEPIEEETASRLEKAGVVVSLGAGVGVDYEKLPEIVDGLLMDFEMRRMLSSRGRELIDGRGCERVVRLIRERVARSKEDRVAL